MKNTKKFLSIIIVAIMTFCLNMFSVSADDTYTITVDNPSTTVSINGKTYTAYKVFSVTYDAHEGAYTYSTDSTCVDLAYSGYDSSLNTVNKVINSLNNDTDARKFGDYVYKNFIQNGSVASSVNQGSATASGEQAVITVPSAGYYLVFGEGDNNNGADGEKTVTSLVMLDTASPSATVKPKFDAPSLKKEIQHNDDNSWGVVSDNQVGDTVNFRLTSTVPDITGYSNYSYIIHDTLGNGLSFTTGSLEVKVNDSTDLDASYYNVSAIDQNLTVTFNVKAAIDAGVVSKSDKLYTYYKATLNSNALIAGPAVDTTNYNENTAYLEYSNNPYSTTTGKTPEAKVYDWTFKYTFDKVNQKGNKVANAGFTVKNASGDVIKFTSKGNNQYIADPNGNVTEIMTTADGTFTLLGLDDNVKYTLEETTVPKGYSKCENVDLTFASSYNAAGSELSTLTATVNGAKSHNDEKATIENQSGSKLVGTGGIGTTVFYVGGGAIMAVAAVLLVTKLRMKNKNI